LEGRGDRGAVVGKARPHQDTNGKGDVTVPHPMVVEAQTKRRKRRDKKKGRWEKKKKNKKTKRRKTLATVGGDGKQPPERAPDAPHLGSTHMGAS